MIQIGDTVRSKNERGQIKCDGKVVALIDSFYYITHMLPKNMDPDVIWGKLYPAWKNEFVVVVFFNFPQRTATLEEWVQSGIHQGHREEDLIKNYENQCPMTQSVVIPISDLEIVKKVVMT